MPQYPSTTYDEFDGGLDLRKGASVSDPKRLRQLQNAYVTAGKSIRKRPVTTKVATLEAGTRGLVSANGTLNTFYESGSITHADPLFTANKVAHPTVTQDITKVHHADVFLGYIYGSFEYADGSIWHHYLDGSSPTHIADANCPQTAQWLKTTNKIWALGPNGDTLPFCATDLPRNWTLVDDAGFLPIGLQQKGGTDAKALGLMDRDLVVFFGSAAQVWVPDANPALHVFKKAVPGVGTRFPGSVQSVSDDLYVLGDEGYRSVVINYKSGNPSDLDVGSPIDKVVKPLITGSIDPVSHFIAGRSQYWCAIGNTVFVYSFSRTAKISAWAVYTLPFTPEVFAELDGVMYARSGDDVYKIDESAYADDGVVFDAVIELPFLDMKRQGRMKEIIGVDAALTGDAVIQFRWDPKDLTKITDPIPLSGDTYGGALTPVGVTAESIAPVITCSNNAEFELDGLTFYWLDRGVV